MREILAAEGDRRVEIELEEFEGRVSAFVSFAYLAGAGIPN